MSRRFKLHLTFCAIVFSVILICGRLLTGIIGDTPICENNQDDCVQPMPSKLLPRSNNNGTYIKKILENTRSKIAVELSKYNFSHSGVRKLEDLLINSGGKPIQSLVISSWRSGSTFFGELLSSIPSTYYHAEPLLKYGIVQIRDPPISNQAVSELKNMLKCNFEGMDDYFEFAKSDSLQFRENRRIWEYCKTKKELCFDADFTSRFCKMFPFQTMKLCRLRLQFVQELLDDEELNVKVILLIRDPRGVFNSRRHRYFCQTGLDCWQPELLCADMIRDYVTANRLLTLYPDRVMVLRFEDLTLNPTIITHRVFKFLKLSVTKSTEDFLKSHTNEEVAGFDSTYRVSRDVPFKWRYLMNFKDIDKIQMVCKEAMRIWGYKMTYNATHMKSEGFNPIENYTMHRAIY